MVRKLSREDDLSQQIFLLAFFMPFHFYSESKSFFDLSLFLDEKWLCFILKIHFHHLSFLTKEQFS